MSESLLTNGVIDGEQWKLCSRPGVRPVRYVPFTVLPKTDFTGSCLRLRECLLHSIDQSLNGLTIMASGRFSFLTKYIIKIPS